MNRQPPGWPRLAALVWLLAALVWLLAAPSPARATPLLFEEISSQHVENKKENNKENNKVQLTTSAPGRKSNKTELYPALPPDELRGGVKPILWDPAWPRFHLGEWIATGAMGVLALASQIPSPSDGPRQGGIWFDEDVRGALRLDDLNDRRAARDISDVLLAAMMAYPLVVDALVVTAWRHRSLDAAWQMTLINAEVMAVNVGIQGLVSFLVNRERPYARSCGGEEPASSRDCDSQNKRQRSFYSGHTAFTFATAGLICSHHLNLKLYGGGAPDIAACATGFVAAAATGTLRMVGDQHYFTDVLTGALVGTITGLGLPWLLHYRFGPKTQHDDPRTVRVQLVPYAAGAGLVGTF